MRGAVFVDSQCFYRDVTAHYSECSNNNIILLDIGGSTTGGGRESIDGQELTHQGRGPVCWRGIITLHEELSKKTADSVGFWIFFVLVNVSDVHILYRWYFLQI